MRAFLLITFVCAVISDRCLAAEFNFDFRRNASLCSSPQNCAVTIDLVGEIEPGDLEKLKRLYEESHGMPYKPTKLNLGLFSRGGDVDTAISIGRYMRQQEGWAFVPIPSECLSSCVLIIAGAVSRTSLGQVGIHRPYFAKVDSLDPATIRANYRKMLARISKFLEEVDVPVRLAEMMMSTPPEQMRILSLAELTDLMLNGTDPAYDEQITARAAKRLGISSAEYRTREARAERACKPLINHTDVSVSRYFDCRDAIMKGR